MKLNRFFGEYNLDKKIIYITELNIVHQIRNVLRLKVGERLVLCDGTLKEAVIEILDFKKNLVKAKVIDVYENRNEPKVSVSLYCSILKRDNFELVCQKACEIGVSEIVPLLTKRTVKLSLKYERLKKIVKEASEQSGRGKVPVINKARKYTDEIKTKKDLLNIFFDEKGEDIDSLKTNNIQNIGIWIGPEGGWTVDELNLASKYNAKIFKLGDLTLRSETAAIIASYIILNKF